MIKVYESGAAFVEENSAVLDRHPLQCGFFYLDAQYMDCTDKRNYVLRATEGEKTLLCMRPLPYNMMLLGDCELVGELVGYLSGAGYELDSVFCDERIGKVFCDYMSREKHIEYYEALAMDYMESATVYAPSNPEVERAAEDDIAELTELMNLFGEECGLEERSTEEDIQRNLDRFRILRRDDSIVAMAALAPDTDRAMHISNVYTRPAYRGQNLASRLVNAGKNEILAKGFIADLNVDQRNPVTNYLYRKLGFERIFAQGQYRIALVESERLRIYPLSDSAMEQLITEEESEEMKLAYGEMLSACKANPRDRVFAAAWVMERKEDGVIVGDLCFKGLGADGAVEIGYGTYEPYQNRGYMTEAVRAMTAWALAQGCVKRVEAETEPDNTASQRVLEKSGFVPAGIIGEEGPRFVWRG